METSQSLWILLYCSCLMLISITQVNECEIPLLHEFNGTAKENGTSIEVCSTCSTFLSYMIFVVLYSSILSHLNRRRKDACYMLQWLVLEQNFSFFMFWQIPIGRSVIILYFSIFFFVSLLWLRRWFLQMLQPSRFLKEIPNHLREEQVCCTVHYP